MTCSRTLILRAAIQYAYQEAQRHAKHAAGFAELSFMHAVDGRKKREFEYRIKRQNSLKACSSYIHRMHNLTDRIHK